MNNIDVVMQECIEFVETYHRLKGSAEYTKKAYDLDPSIYNLGQHNVATEAFRTFKSNMPRAIQLMDDLITAVEKQGTELKSDR